MDPREYLNDVEEAQRLAHEGWQSDIWTALPCVVVSVNWEAMSLVCQPVIQGRMLDSQDNLTFVNLPTLLDVPICFPSCAGFAVTMPLAAGDEVLVIFSSRCIDSWWYAGWSQAKPCLPSDYRMHDLSDGFAIPGPKSIPNVFPSISSTDLQIRNSLGTTYLSIGADGKIGFINPTTSLKNILTNLESTLSTFMEVLAAFSGGSASVTQTMLQAPAATAVSSLSTILTEIGALLK